MAGEGGDGDGVGVPGRRPRHQGIGDSARRSSRRGVTKDACGRLRPIFAEAKICRPANTLRLSLSFYEAGGLRPQRFRVVDPRRNVLGPAAGTVGHLPGARLWRGTKHGAGVDGNVRPLVVVPVRLIDAVKMAQARMALAILALCERQDGDEQCVRSAAFGMVAREGDAEIRRPVANQSGIDPPFPLGQVKEGATTEFGKNSTLSSKITAEHLGR